MKRNAGTVALAAAMLAALGGCAYQDPLALPDLGPPARSSHQQYPQQPYSQPYPSYSPYYGYGFSYGYGSGYRPGYDPYYNYYYGSDPRYYRPGVVYVPYPQYVPVPCADANRDGRCDKRPRGGNGDGHDGGVDDGHDGGGGKYGRGVERWPRSQDGQDGGKGDGPRLRRNGGEVDRYVAPGMSPGVAPAPVILRPSPDPVLRTAPPAARPPQARPPESQRRVAPPPPSERGPRVGPGRSSTADDDVSPQRRPDA